MLDSMDSTRVSAQVYPALWSQEDASMASDFPVNWRMLCFIWGVLVRLVLLRLVPPPPPLVLPLFWRCCCCCCWA